MKLVFLGLLECTRLYYCWCQCVLSQQRCGITLTICSFIPLYLYNMDWCLCAGKSCLLKISCALYFGKIGLRWSGMTSSSCIFIHPFLQLSVRLDSSCLYDFFQVPHLCKGVREQSLMLANSYSTFGHIPSTATVGSLRSIWHTS